MVNLLGASVESDLEDFKSFFTDHRLRPDDSKYPCALVEDTELYGAYEKGDWAPYAPQDLESLLKYILLSVPLYCRVSRMIRDFSADDIVVGNKKANLRQIIQHQLSDQEQRPVEIRSREIRSKSTHEPNAIFSHIQYETGAGEEAFLQFTTSDDKILAYLRLGLPRIEAPFQEIVDAALVREVHVYGKSLPLHGPTKREPASRLWGTAFGRSSKKLHAQRIF